ncbi:ATP-binding cassette domain-containing protein [bacterium]|nr:MAG: ATP-binding cassette domain-containing protein [bacterium]
MVAVNGIRKEFRDRKSTKVAIEDVSFQAHPGEIFGLLGVNGAGKTTTLRILSTVLEATAGSATVAGHDVASEPAKVRASIGFLSSSTALYGRLTPRETLHYFGNLYGLEGARLKERTEYVIEKLALQEFIDRPCEKLSTGQKQRTSIGRTILHDPPVLFFDEPTAGLDVVASQTVMEFIEEARGAGKTIIFSTHIMSEVERLCDRVMVIHDGRVRGEDTVDGLRKSTGQPTLEKAFLSMVGYRSEVA